MTMNCEYGKAVTVTVAVMHGVMVVVKKVESISYKRISYKHRLQSQLLHAFEVLKLCFRPGTS